MYQLLLHDWINLSHINDLTSVINAIHFYSLYHNVSPPPPKNMVFFPRLLRSFTLFTFNKIKIKEVYTLMSFQLHGFSISLIFYHEKRQPPSKCPVKSTENEEEKWRREKTYQSCYHIKWKLWCVFSLVVRFFLFSVTPFCYIWIEFAHKLQWCYVYIIKWREDFFCSLLFVSIEQRWMWIDSMYPTDLWNIKRSQMKQNTHKHKHTHCNIRVQYLYI